MGLCPTQIGAAGIVPNWPSTNLTLCATKCRNLGAPARGKREERANSTMTAVNILEKQQNLLQANSLRQLLMYSDCDFMLLNIVLCIVNAKLLVKLGDMDKDRVALNHPDNPPSTCRHTSKNAHDSDPTAPKVSSRHTPVSRSFGTMPSGLIFNGPTGG